MSKSSFCTSMLQDMNRRLLYLDNDAYLEYLKPSDTFSLVLCIAYMVLSKEKIIIKDKKIEDPIKRIESRVDRSKIEGLFQGENAPIIISSYQMDPLWILDDIRDSIMHEGFDIDEENRNVIIHNTKRNRELDAIIPFDWFYKYMNQSIYESRHTNHFTKKYFYRNPYINSSNKLRTAQIISSSILYKVDVIGEELPIKELDSTISSIMEEASLLEVSEDELLKYQDSFPYKREDIDIRYYISFHKARRILEEKLKEKYPNCKVIIRVDEKKKKLIKKANRMMFNSYYDYDDIFKQLNSVILRRKSNTLLNSIMEIYHYMNSDSILEDDPRKEIIHIVNGNDSFYGNSIEANLDLYRDSKDQLRYILLHLFGLVTLVSNDEDFREIVSSNDLTNSFEAFSKDSFVEFSSKKRGLLNRFFDAKIGYIRQKNNLDAISDEATKMKVQSIVDAKLEKVDSILDELELLNHGYQDQNYPFDDISISTIRSSYQNKLLNLLYQFNYSNDISTMKTLAHDILVLYDQKTEYEMEHVFSKCTPSELLELMRNCFAHFGRVHLKDSHSMRGYLLSFYDFDDQNNLAGYARCSLNDFIELMNICSKIEEDKQKSLIKK